MAEVTCGHEAGGATHAAATHEPDPPATPAAALALDPTTAAIREAYAREQAAAKARENVETPKPKPETEAADESDSDDEPLGAMRAAARERLDAATFTSTANDEGDGDAARAPAEPRALPMAAPPPPPVESDGDATMPDAPPAWHNIAVGYQIIATGSKLRKKRKPSEQRLFDGAAADENETAVAFVARIFGATSREQSCFESLATFMYGGVSSAPKLLKDTKKAIFDALEGVSAAEFLAAASASGSASAPAKFAKDTHVEDVADPTVRGVVLKVIDTRFREVATTECTVVIRYTNQLKSVTLMADEVARCVIPATPKDYAQARIDGLIRFSYDGHVYRNRFTAADGSTELFQFKVSDTRVRCVHCEAKTWALSSDISKIVKEVNDHSIVMSHQKAVATAAGALQAPSAPVPRIAPTSAPPPSLYDRRVTKADWPAIEITDDFQKKRELAMPVVVTDWAHGMCEGWESERFPGRKRIKINPSGGTLSFQKVSSDDSADALCDRLDKMLAGSVDPYAGPTYLNPPPLLLGKPRATLVHTSADRQIAVLSNPWATRPGARLFLVKAGGVVDKLLQDGAKCAPRESELHRRGKSGAPSGVNWYVAAPRSRSWSGMMSVAVFNSTNRPPP